MAALEQVGTESKGNGSLGEAEWIKRAEAAVGDALREGGNFIRKHPIAAVAIGFGVGLLVGAFLRRRD